MLPRLLDNRSRARAARNALLLGIAAAAIDLCCRGRWLAAAAPRDEVAGAVAALDLARAGVLAIVLVPWLLWFRRASDNARALGLPWRWWPGWAVLAWLVPLLNVFWPWRMALDLWRHAAALHPLRGNPAVPLFANFLLGSGLAARAAQQSGAGSAPVADALRLGAAADLLLLFAGVFALRYVRGVTAAHTRIAAPAEA